MSTKQQPEASKRRCGAVQSEQAEKMMIVTDDHRSNCEQMEGKERADEHIISNKLTSNDKQNSNDSGKPGSNQQKLLDIQSSKATTSAASTSKVSSAASTSKMASAASTSKMASSKAVLTSKVTKPTTSTAASATAVSSFPAPVLPFSTDDLPDGLPVLCIHRLYRDETGAEYRHTEVVDHPQVIDNYLKLRTLVGPEQLRHYAFSDSESLQDFKQFKRKIGKRLAYHGQKQQQQRKIDEAMKRKPQQQQGCSSSTVGETGVQLELGASRNKLQSQSSLPANSQSQPPPNKKIIKMEPSAHTCASHCRACGQKGHIRTNKICPKHPANQQQLNTIKEEANAEQVNDDSGGGQSTKAVNELAKLPNADLPNQSANPPAAPAKGTNKPMSTAAATVVKMEPTTDQRQSTGSSGYDTSSSNLADDQKHNSPKAASCTSKDTGGHARLARAATTAAVPVLTGLRRGRKRRCCSPRIEEQQPQQQHVLEKCLREK